MLPLSYRFAGAGAVVRPKGFGTAWRRYGDTLFSRIRGKGYLIETDDGRRVAVGPDEGFCIPPGVRHRVSAPDHEVTAVYAHLHCRVYELQGLFTVHNRPILFDRAAAARVGACNEALCGLQDGPRTLGRSVEASRHMACLVAIAVERCPRLEQAWAAPERRRLLPAIGFVQDHLSRNITRARIARAAGVSVPHLHVLFMRAFGVAPMELVRRERMQKARQLLHWSDLSIAEVARECGFDDQFYFSRAFRKEEGVPPSRYRRDIRV